MASSGTTFALAQGGSFTIDSDAAGASPGPNPQGFKIGSVRKTRSVPQRAVTGACDGNSPDVGHFYLHGVPADHFIVRGWVADCSTAKFGLTQSATVSLNSGNYSIHVTDFRLHKSFPLTPVTGSSGGSADGDSAQYLFGVPTYSLQGRGWTIGASGPGLSTLEERVSLVIDGLGTVAWDTADSTASQNDGKLLKVEETSADVPFSQGGGVPVNFSGLMQGQVSYTQGSQPADWSWLFNPTNLATNGDKPQKVACALDTSAETITDQSTLWYDVALSLDLTRGGGVEVSARAIFDKA